jgi:two-component sensor histidine kinase
VAVFEVITERKRAEAALKESEEKLRCLFQILPVGLSILGRNRELISTNDALSRILRLPEGDLAPALSSRSFVDSAGRPMPIRDFPSVRAAAERRPVENVEIGSVLETGETLWVKVSAVPTPFSDWDIALTVTDIGEQKSTEERLEKALADLELLMKELQHRVKNNLEIVMNLLSFGYEEAMDEGARRVLADARSRVGAMEAIYEALVYSDSFDRIELGLFLERFLESLHETYVIDRESIRFETRIETYEIDHRRAVSLGLILNELVTNALKYAYPRGSGGPIEIDLLKTEEGLRLRVADRGPGLPPGMDPSSSASMGFTLVRLLASQLNSRLEVESAGGSGTQATICIPL